MNNRQFLFECSCGMCHKITERQLQVLRLLASGKDNEAIGAAMIVGTKSVENYIHAIFKALPCLTGHKRVAAGLWYQEHRLEDDYEEPVVITFNHRSLGVDGLRSG
jgi:DNA-binding NarL/FixJ family response regulator